MKEEDAIKHFDEVADALKCYTLPYYMLNLAGVDTTIHRSSGQLTAQMLQIGELVGFKNREGRDLIGKIERLNNKTVSMFVPSTQERWRVHYGNLYRVYEGEQVQSSGDVIVGQLVDQSDTDEREG